MVYIFSEKQIFLNRVFSLDETNDDQMKANPLTMKISYLQLPVGS